MPTNQNRLRDILFFLLVLFYKFNRIVIHVLIICIYMLPCNILYLHYKDFFTTMGSADFSQFVVTRLMEPL